MTDTAKLDATQRKALLAQLIREHGVATIIEDLASTLCDFELDSRNEETSDAWAEIAGGIRISSRSAIRNGHIAMGDFAPVTVR